MRHTLAIAADDRPARPTETAQDIGKLLDQSIKGAETDLAIAGRSINGHREESATTTALAEPTVLPIEPAEAGKGGKGGDFRINEC